MSDASLSDRFVVALKSEKLVQSLYDLAVTLKTEGHGQREIVSLFDSFRGKYADTEPPEYDAILDVMDYLVGYGRRDACIFDSPLDDA